MSFVPLIKVARLCGKEKLVKWHRTDDRTNPELL